MAEVNQTYLKKTSFPIGEQVDKVIDKKQVEARIKSQIKCN